MDEVSNKVKCKLCGKLFVPKKKTTQVYCESTCREESHKIRHWKHYANPIKANCLICNNEFIKTSASQFLCSSKCRLEREYSLRPKAKSISKECCVCGESFKTHIGNKNRVKTCGNKKCQKERLKQNIRNKYLEFKESASTEEKELLLKRVRENGKRSRDSLSDVYVRRELQKELSKGNIQIALKAIPQELVDMKRADIIYYRSTKNLRQKMAKG